jgi:insulysin
MTFMKKGKSEWLVYGNVSEEDASDFVAQSEKELGFTQVDQEMHTFETFAIKENKKAQISLDVIDKTNENSALLAYFQTSQNNQDISTRILVQLGRLYLDEPTFNQLRTIEQLGYIVFTSIFSSGNDTGTYVLVQSPTYSCSHIETSLNSHLSNMLAKVAELSDEDFETLKGSLMIELT